MRVLAAIVIPPHMSASGAVRAGERLSAELSRHCDVTVASMMNGKAIDRRIKDIGSVERLEIRSRLPPLLPWSRIPQGYGTPFYSSDIPEIVRRERFDLVHIHNPMPGLEMERVGKACRQRGIPYVISTHGYNEIANGEAIHRFSVARRLAWRTLVSDPVRRVTANADGVFALSPADVAIVRRMGFEGEISIVTNGVDLPPENASATDEAALHRYAIPRRGEDDVPTFMFLANHTPNKGLPVLLEAFRGVHSPYRLILGGEQRGGIDYDGARKACGPGQEIIVTGRLEDEEVSALLRRSDLFVFPTLADTLPLVVLEAMAHGKPVLASRVGGIPFQLDGESGVLVPPGDPAVLAAEIERLARSPDRLAEMGRHARARVEAHFTWPIAAQQALAGYERVLRREVRVPARSQSRLLPLQQDTLG